MKTALRVSFALAIVLLGAAAVSLRLRNDALQAAQATSPRSTP